MNSTNPYTKIQTIFICIGISVFVVYMAVQSATTISSDISTGGTLTVTGASTFTGGFLSSASSTINSDLVVTGTATSTAYKITCPTGFVTVEAAGQQLGCIQKDEEGSDEYIEANNDCFTTYGGRLPTPLELTSIFLNASSTLGVVNLDDDSELTTDLVGTASSARVVVFNGASATFPFPSVFVGSLITTTAYRCFIPK